MSIYHFNYVSTLKNQCDKKRIPEPIYTDITDLNNEGNQSKYRMNVKIDFEGKDFLSIGKGKNLDEAKKYAAKHCILKLFVYLFKQNPTLSPYDYGISYEDLQKHNEIQTTENNRIDLTNKDSMKFYGNKKHSKNSPRKSDSNSTSNRNGKNFNQSDSDNSFNPFMNENNEEQLSANDDQFEDDENLDYSEEYISDEFGSIKSYHTYDEDDGSRSDFFRIFREGRKERLHENSFDDEKYDEEICKLDQDYNEDDSEDYNEDDNEDYNEDDNEDDNEAKLSNELNNFDLNEEEKSKLLSNENEKLKEAIKYLIDNYDYFQAVLSQEGQISFKELMDNLIELLPKLRIQYAQPDDQNKFYICKLSFEDACLNVGFDLDSIENCARKIYFLFKLQCSNLPKI